MSRRANPQRGCKEKDSGHQTTLTGNFLKSSVVEIIDDDGDDVTEVDPVHSSPRSHDDEERLIVRRPRTRRKRREVQLNWDDEENGAEQDEDQQLQEAIRQSRLDAKKDDERRAMCGNPEALLKLQQNQKSSTTGMEPAGSNTENKSKIGVEASTSQMPATLQAEYNSGSLSPLLFAESDEIQAQDDAEEIEEFPDSPPVPVGSRTPGSKAPEAKASSSRSQTALNMGKLKLSRLKLGDVTCSHGTAAMKELVLDVEGEVEEREPAAADHAKSARKIRLARRYRKSYRSPRTLAEAMKAQLYFAPAGFDVAQYTGVILKLFELSNRRLRRAQSQLLDKIEWSVPATPWPRAGRRGLDLVTDHSGDARPTVSLGVDKEASTVISERSRSLRSARAVVKPTSNPTTPKKRTLIKECVGDDSDDDDVQLGQPAEPLSWKEHLARAESEQTFPVEEEVSVPSPDKTPLSRKRKDNSVGTISKETGESNVENNETSNGGSDVPWLAAHSSSMAASPRKKSKLEEQATADPEKIPSESCGMSMTSAETDRQSGMPGLVTKRSRKLSSDSDETDDERETVSCKTPPSAVGLETTPEAAVQCANTAEVKSARSVPSQFGRAQAASPRRAIFVSSMKANTQRERSDAVIKAAAAAERRLMSNAPVAAETSKGDVQCPMCFQNFSQCDIEAHASDCVGSSPPRITPPQTTLESSPTRLYQTVTGESRELKELRVVLERSPIVQANVLRPAPSKSTIKSLSFASEGDKDTQRHSRARDLRSADNSGPEVLKTSSKSSQERRRAKPGEQPQEEGGPGADFWPLNIDDPTNPRDHNADGRSPVSTALDTSGTRSDPGDAVERELLVQQRSKLRAKNKKAPNSWTREDDENERALLQLAGLDESGKTQRRGKATESESDDEDEHFQTCYLCNRRIPKTEYSEHVEREIEERERHGRDSEEEEISHSPIKAFKLIGEDSTQIDYHNQFAHLARNEGGEKKGGSKRKAPGVGWWRGGNQRKKAGKRFKTWSKR